jgi:hypothetical protein
LATPTYPQAPRFEPPSGHHADQAPLFPGFDDRQDDPHARYDDALYGSHGDDPRAAQNYDSNAYDPNAYDPNGYDPNAYGDDEYQPVERSRGNLVKVAAVLVLAVVGTAAAFAYRSYSHGTRSGEPPIIKADTGPSKIVPPTQSGEGSGKLIYDRIGAAPGGSGERVVSREEQPVNVQDATKTGPRVVFPPLNQNPAAAASPQPVRTATSAVGDEPRRIKTMPIRPDQPEAAPAPPPRQTTRPAPAAVNANAAAPAGNAPLALSPQAAGDGRVRTASTSAAAPVSGSGGYVVQVSSQRSEADAQASYRALQSKFPSVLGSRAPLIKRADLGDKGVYYRAMIGPFSSQDDASQFCGSLKTAGGQCVVQRN